MPRRCLQTKDSDGGDSVGRKGARIWEFAEYLSWSWWEDADTILLNVRRRGLWATGKEAIGRGKAGKATLDTAGEVLCQIGAV